MGSDSEAIRIFARTVRDHATTGRPRSLPADLAGRAGLTPPRRGRCYALAGDREAALEHLKRALPERSPEIIHIGVDEAFAGLRGEERLGRLLDGLGLEVSGAR